MLKVYKLICIEQLLKSIELLLLLLVVVVVVVVVVVRSPIYR
jgi:hypothetical protein